MSLYVTSISGMGSGEDSGGGALQNLAGMTDADYMYMSKDFINQAGVHSISDTDFETTEDSPAAMSVEVKAGTCYVLSDSWTKNSDTLKFWRVESTAVETVTIDANASGSTRYDVICVKIDTGASPDDTASNVATVIAVKGTPGAGVPATPANHLKLAEVEVANGASSITNSEITDSRVQSRIDVSSIANTAKVLATLTSNQSITQSSPTLIAYATEVYDPGSNFNNTATNYSFTAPIDGYYYIEARILFSAMADAKRILLNIKKNSTDIAIESTYTSTSSNQSVSVRKIELLSSGDIIQAYVNQLDTTARNIDATATNSFFNIHLLSV